MNDQEQLDIVAAFRRELDGMPDPPRRAPRLIPVAAAAVVAAGAGVALVAGSGDGTPQAKALAITRQADWIDLRIADISASPAQMNKELKEAGINGRIVLAAVPPENIGVWILTSQTAVRQKCVVPEGQTAPEIERRNTSMDKIERIPKGRPTTLRVPTALVRESSAAGSRFLFVAGRPARAGERILDEDRLLETLEPSVRGRPTIGPGLSPRQLRAKLRELEAKARERGSRGGQRPSLPTCKPGQQP